MNIQSQYEKRELCKRVIEICFKNKLFEDWYIFCDMYFEFLEKKEQEAYLIDNEKYRLSKEADEKMSLAIDEYINHNSDTCRELLLECSEIYDKIFEEQYNPALLNICFMARRKEIPELNIDVLEVLNKITWMEQSAFLNINRALVYVLQNDWVNARAQITDIESDLESALEWWNREDVVGRKEKYTVLLLLLLGNKLEESNIEVQSEDFWQFCKANIPIPSLLKEELNSIKSKRLIHYKENIIT